jgi:hypothetical protein
MSGVAEGWVTMVAMEPSTTMAAALLQPRFPLSDAS